MKNFVLYCFAAFFIAALPSHAQETQGDARSRDDENAVKVLIEDEEYKNAIARVEAALKKDKKNSVLLLQRGLVLVKLDRLDDAKAHYKKLKRRIKNNPEPWNNLAMVYRLEGNYEQAVTEFKKTIKRFPDYVTALENLGDTYIEMAQRAYAAGAEIDPKQELLVSKSELGLEFSTLAVSNTPSAKRRALAKQKRSNKEITKKTAVSLLVEQQVFDLLNSWITSWSERNIEKFLSHYSNQYIPQNNISLEEWLAGKSKAISQAKYIRIKLDDIKIEQFDQSNLTATFKQYYESDSSKNRSIKTLGLRVYNGQWFIVRESSRTTS
ncbi:MAG: tetratricopeptide repeat protein [Acidiferrobacterales bacterium]|nr:tetratricopeptide repeat protein [Acidiferrobacterales bacterium]